MDAYGKTFRLKSAILAIEASNGHPRRTTYLPARLFV